MADGRIVIDTKLDTKGVQKDLSGLKGKFKSFGGRLKTTGKTLSKGLTAPLVGLGGVLAGVTQKTVNYASATLDAAQQAGLSVETYQELEYALGAAGVQTQDADRAFGRLSQRIGRAIDGNQKYADAFKAVGVSITDASGNARDADDVFMETVDALSKIENPAERSAKASEIFGTRLARKLMPALEGGADALEKNRKRARELGIVMSEEAVNDASEFEQAMDDLKRQFGGVFREVGMKLIPILQEDLLPAIEQHVIPAVEKFGDWLADLIGWFADLSPTTQKWIGIIVGVAAALGPVIGVLGMLATAFGALMSPIGLVMGIIGAFIAITVAIIANWGPIKEFFLSLWERVKGIFGKAADWIKNLWNKTVGRFINKVTEMKDKGVQKFKDILSGAKRIFSNMVERIRSIISRVTNFLTSPFRKGWNWIKGLPGKIVSFFSGLPGKIGRKVSGVLRKLKSPFVDAWNWIKGLPGRIKDIFTGWGISLPSIKLPHFSVRWSTSGFWGSVGELLGLPGRPILDVSWYAKGGIVDGAQIIGVGEAGPEAVVPLSGGAMRPFAQAIASELDKGGPNEGAVYEFHLDIPLDGETIAKKTVRFTAEELEGLKRRNRRKGGR